MLNIPEHTMERYIEVQQWAIENGLIRQFQEGMARLRNYGCHPGEDAERCRVTLFPDFAPQSFAFVIEGRQAPHDDYTTWFNGGLIYQGPSSPADDGAPSFTVSLHDDIGWFMHT